AWSERSDHGAEIACTAAIDGDGLAIAFATGDILVEGGRFDGRGYAAGKLTCITAIAATATDLYVANGSATNLAADWTRDLLERTSSGSIWRIDLASGTSSRLADGLAWPAGLAVDAEGLVVCEAWKHQLSRIDPARPETPRPLHADLPAYPGRIAPAT